MTAAESTFVRLLVALEDFAAQEAVELEGGNIAAVQSIQRRADPVVEELVRLGRSAIPPEIHSRLVALVHQRVQNQENLERRIGRMRDALGQTQSNLRRIGQIAPVYGRTDRMVAPKIPTTRAIA